MFKKLLIAASMMASATTAHAMNINPEVAKVQAYVNDRIYYALDRGGKDIWKIPTKFGDCEDYALLKRKMLIDSGWNESDLEIWLLTKKIDGKKLITIGHVVLYVRSENLILDMPKNANVSSASAFGRYAKGKAEMPMEEYLKNEEFNFFCKIADISEGVYPTVSQRCEKKKK